MKALLCGTKPTSIARFLGDELLKREWEVYLFSRNAWPPLSDKGKLHIARADIEFHARSLTASCPDLVVMNADSGGVFGNFIEIGPTRIRNFLDSKICASVLMLQAVLASKYRTKIVFLCGRNGPKAAHYMLYGVVNAAIMALVNEFNRHHGNLASAYYLETPVIRGSTIAEECRKETFDDTEGFEMNVLLDPLLAIIDGTTPPGFVPFLYGKVL